MPTSRHPTPWGATSRAAELDLLMARAFRLAGASDSSEMYASYVRSAWRNADPEVKAELLRFERDSTNEAP